MKKIHKNDRGIKHFFGKRYMWLLDQDGQLGLHKVDDRGTKESTAKLRALIDEQNKQS